MLTVLQRHVFFTGLNIHTTTRIKRLFVFVQIFNTVLMMNH